MARVECRAVLLASEPHRPLSFLTLTTRDPDTPLEVFAQGVASVFLRLRRRWRPVDYYGTIEGTSGRLARDGRRRMHGHFLVKGIPGESVAAAKLLARDTWSRSLANALGEGGRAWRITLSVVRDEGAVASYLASYLGKFDQVMDADWGGRRIRSSQGFFPDGRVLTRERARAELYGEADAWRAGFDSSSAEAGFYRAVAVAALEGKLEARERRRAELAELARLVMLDYATGEVSVPPASQLSLDGIRECF